MASMSGAPIACIDAELGLIDLRCSETTLGHRPEADRGGSACRMRIVLAKASRTRIRFTSSIRRTTKSDVRWHSEFLREHGDVAREYVTLKNIWRLWSTPRKLRHEKRTQMRRTWSAVSRICYTTTPFYRTRDASLGVHLIDSRCRTSSTEAPTGSCVRTVNHQRVQAIRRWDDRMYEEDAAH